MMNKNSTKIANNVTKQNKIYTKMYIFKIANMYYVSTHFMTTYKV